MIYKHLYLLMEIADREFESNFLLGFHAVHHGWKVLICQRTDFFDNIKKFPKGIVVYKSIVPSDVQIIDLVKKNGHIFVCIDAEGINQKDELYTLNLRYGQACLDKLDHIFVLNTHQEKLLKNNYKINNKVSVTGYPRIEFLNVLKKANENTLIQGLKTKHGRFIFFPTSFAYSNHIVGEAGLRVVFEDASGKLNEKQEKFFQGNVLLSKYVQKKYEDLLEKIADTFKGINIILRPHPAENCKYWEDRYKYHKNIIVEYAYPAIYYIKACELVIQYGSTIAIESKLLGKFCLQFDPNLPYHLNQFIVKENQRFAWQVTSIEEAVSVIRTFLCGSNKDGGQVHGGAEYPSNLGASEDIVHVLNGLVDTGQIEKMPHLFPSILSRTSLERNFLWGISKTGIIDILPQDRLASRFTSLKKERKKLYVSYYKSKKRKYSKITSDRIQESLKMFKKQWPDLNRSIEIREKSFNAIEMQPLKQI